MFVIKIFFWGGGEGNWFSLSRARSAISLRRVRKRLRPPPNKSDIKRMGGKSSWAIYRFLFYWRYIRNVFCMRRLTSGTFSIFPFSSRMHLIRRYRSVGAEGRRVTTGRLTSDFTRNLVLSRQVERRVTFFNGKDKRVTCYSTRYRHPAGFVYSRCAANAFQHSQ